MLSFVASLFGFVYHAIAGVMALVFTFTTYPLRLVPLLSTFLYSIFLLPVIELADIAAYAIILPFKPALNLLGIDINNLGSYLPHAEFILTNLYQFVAVAALLGVIVGVQCGLTLGLISFVLTPKRTTKKSETSLQLQQSHKYAHSDPETLPQLIANIPNKLLPLSLSDLKIDIRYDTPSPKPEEREERDENADGTELVQSATFTHHPMRRSSAIDYHHDDVDLRNRLEDTTKTENDLFTARTEDTDVTYATNQIKNYSKDG